MRDTEYARELCEPGVMKWPSGGSEARIEKLLIKETDEEEIRFSWWKDGKLAIRPLDLSEHDLIALFRDALRESIRPRVLAAFHARHRCWWRAHRRNAESPHYVPARASRHAGGPHARLPLAHWQSLPHHTHKTLPHASALSAATRLVPYASSRSRAATRAPNAQRVCAVAAPMPIAPPVMTTLSRNVMLTVVLLLYRSAAPSLRAQSQRRTPVRRGVDHRSLPAIHAACLQAHRRATPW